MTRRNDASDRIGELHVEKTLVSTCVLHGDMCIGDPRGECGIKAELKASWYGRIG